MMGDWPQLNSCLEFKRPALHIGVHNSDSFCYDSSSLFLSDIKHWVTPRTKHKTMLPSARKTFFFHAFSNVTLGIDL